MNEAQGILGLASRARMVTFGDTAMKELRAHRAYLMIMSHDTGSNTRKKIIDKCNFYEVPLVFMDGDTMNQSIGKENRKFIAILDEGFAKRLHACLKG